MQEESSPNRKTMHTNFMRRIDENPLNFANFLKPKKPKVPSYLKEDYPDPKYFACKNYIARIPQHADRPSADALDLIVTKIYHKVKHGLHLTKKSPKAASIKGSSSSIYQQSPKKKFSSIRRKSRKESEMIEEDDFLYLQFFGDSNLERIRSQSPHHQQKKDRRKEFARQAIIQQKLREFKKQSRGSVDESINASSPKSRKSLNRFKGMSATQNFAFSPQRMTQNKFPVRLPQLNFNQAPQRLNKTFYAGESSNNSKFDILSRFQSNLGPVPQSIGERPMTGEHSLYSPPKTQTCTPRNITSVNIDTNFTSQTMKKQMPPSSMLPPSTSIPIKSKVIFHRKQKPQTAQTTLQQNNQLNIDPKSPSFTGLNNFQQSNNFKDTLINSPQNLKTNRRNLLYSTGMGRRMSLRAGNKISINRSGVNNSALSTSRNKFIKNKNTKSLINTANDENQRKIQQALLRAAKLMDRRKSQESVEDESSNFYQSSTVF